MQAAASSPAALLGRATEIDQLRSALAAALAGTGQVVLVAGDAGIGKTTLVESLAGEAARSGVTTVWGRCWEAGGARAYWPWTQVIRACMGEGDAAGDVDDLLLANGAHAPTPAGGPLPESPADRYRLFQAVIELLRRVATPTGLLVVLEDLHAADEVSLQLLAHAGRSLSDARVLLLGTHRDAEPGWSPRQRRAIAAAAASGTRLLLQGLDADAVAQLLERRGEGMATAETARHVQEVTDGNPFFVQEVGRVLAAGRQVSDLPPGEEVAALVHRRLARLRRETRLLLSQAALLGREFNSQLLGLVGCVSPAALLDAMAEAEAARVVDASGLGRWSFTHALIREALTEGLADSTRRHLHTRSGEVIEGLYADDLAPHYAQLAHHFSEAGSASKAADYGELAGRQALASLAFEDARVHFDRAVAALAQRPPDDRRRYELVMALARVQFLSNDFDDARRSHDQACRLARRLGDPELVARAALGYFGYWKADEKSQTLLEEALGALPEYDSPIRAELLLNVAAARWFGPDASRRETWRELGEEGLQTARRLDDPPCLGRALVFWHRLLLDLDLESLPDRLELAREAVRVTSDTGDREQAFFARLWQVGDLVEAGEMARAAEALELAAVDARDRRLPYLLWAVTYLRSTLAMHEGRLDEAERLAQSALRAGELTGSQDAEAIVAGVMAFLFRHRGEFGELLALIPRVEPPLAPYRALALAELGRTEESYHAIRDAIVEAAKLTPHRHLWSAYELAEACWMIGDQEMASRLYDLLLPYGQRHLSLAVAIATMGSSSRILGQLATVLGRYDDADAHFADAHAHHQRLGTPLWLAYGQADHARMLLTSGDNQRAAALAACARDAFRNLGMTFYENRAADLIGDAGGGELERATLRFDGQDWTIRYAGRLVRLGDAKGLHHLAVLLACPGEQLPATSIGSGGDAELARLNVSRAIRTAIDRIGAAHPPLGDHLKRTIRTGARCAYTPDPRAPVRWETSPAPSPT